MDPAAVTVVAEKDLDGTMQVGTGLGTIQEDNQPEKGVPTLTSSPHNAPDTVAGPIEVSTATRPRCIAGREPQQGPKQPTTQDTLGRTLYRPPVAASGTRSNHNW